MEASVSTQGIHGVYTTSIVATVIANCCYLKMLSAGERVSGHLSTALTVVKLEGVLSCHQSR